MIRIISPLMLACVLAFAGCMSEGGSNSEAQILATEGNGAYQIVYLPTGRLIPSNGIFDPNNNPLLRDDYIAFARIAAAEDYQIGAATPIVGVPTILEPVQTAVVSEDYYVSVFEVSQSQWQRLGGSPVWNTLNPASLGSESSFVGGELPACNLSLDDVESTLSAYNALEAIDDNAILRLPTDLEWEVAARFRRYGLFHWGDGVDQSTIDRFAKVRETDISGIQPVGKVQPNDLGLFDVNGNVAEITADSTLRGGAWHHNVVETRCSAKIELPADNIRFPQAGVRLILEIP